ncbi:HlyD family secretion protein [Burkholderia pseudomallei]|uniref:HlyD family secretion protein n=1 Tax=Burkholderia pseudomallei TaxID=28450 RepID=UPI0019403102|nr:HlyD family secretion protein [Burkholderia pseudomallei]MBM5584963.1 HlyD family efflux transporter periplasmic adaptor subunit [Burkholderia pseudomallei]
MKKKTSLIIAVTVVVLVFVFLGLRKTGLSSTGMEITDDAYIAADFTLVAPKVSGLVSKVAVEDNQRVRAGDLLAKIDDRDFQVALQNAQSELLAAEARLKNVQARDARQHAMIEQAEAVVHADDAAVLFAEQNAKRYEELSKQGAGTQEQQQQTFFTQRQQAAIRKRDIAALTGAQKELGVLASEEAEANAAVGRAKAAVEQARLNLSYTTIIAPVDGVVGQRNVRVGAYVSPGKTLLAVVPLEKAYVVANFREVQLKHIKPGQRAHVRVDAMPDVLLAGRVESIAPATGLTFAPIAPDNATGNFTKVVQRLPVKIVFDADQADAARLKVGMSVVPSVDVSGGDGR